MVRFKIDENLPVGVAHLLRSSGHDALTVLEENLGGQHDPDLMRICMEESRALVTLDVDFADIRTYAPQQLPGLIVLSTPTSG